MKIPDIRGDESSISAKEEALLLRYRVSFLCSVKHFPMMSFPGNHVKLLFGDRSAKCWTISNCNKYSTTSKYSNTYATYKAWSVGVRNLLLDPQAAIQKPYFYQRPDILVAHSVSLHLAWVLRPRERPKKAWNVLVWILRYMLPCCCAHALLWKCNRLYL